MYTTYATPLNICWHMKWVLQCTHATNPSPLPHNWCRSTQIQKTDIVVLTLVSCVWWVNCWPSHINWYCGLIGNRSNCAAFAEICPATKSKHLFFHYMFVLVAEVLTDLYKVKLLVHCTVSDLLFFLCFLVCRTGLASFVAINIKLINTLMPQ